MTRDEAIALAKQILQNPQKYALVDTETTGFQKPVEVLEFAAIDPTGGVLAHFFSMPKHSPHKKAVEVHGLSLSHLEAIGAKPWRTRHDEVIQALGARTLVAYNVRYDLRALQDTALANVCPLPKFDTICAMEMWYAFTGQRKGKLKGDHSAIGDSLSMLEMIKEIASAPLSAQPTVTVKARGLTPIAEALPLVELQIICDRLEEIKAASKHLKAEEADLKDKLAGMLELSEEDTLVLPNGMAASFGRNIVRLKPVVPVEELPDSWRSLAFDKKAAEREILSAADSDQQQEALKKFVSWETSKFLMISKRK